MRLNAAMTGWACGVVMILLGWTAAAQEQDPADMSLAGRINLAIERGVEHLSRHQHRDGSWTGARFGSYRSGPTAFTAYVLVESGVSHDAPAIRMALAYLVENPPTMTYSAGALMMLLAEIHANEPLNKELMALAESTFEKLVEWENAGLRGSWAYPGGQVDLSNTQFAALGFWAASRIGLKVPVDITQRMVMTTIDKHQEEPFKSPVELASRKGKSRAGGTKIAGFYYLPNPSKPARGSMTVAGICVQRIAREIFKRKLGNKVLKASDKSEDKGMGWLEAHWSVTKNHGMPADEDGLLYYLWGIERLAALLDTDDFFGHDWYSTGAEKILAMEKGDGSWGHYDLTGYSLLFLSRATRAASSGKRRAKAPEAWTQEDGPIKFRVTGQMDFTSWIVGLERKDPVSRVEWFLDGVVIAERESTQTKRPWKGERYPARWSDDVAREREVSVRVLFVGDDTPVESDPLKVTSHWTHGAWAERAATQLEDGAFPMSLLVGTDPIITVSSTAAGQDAPRAVDGLEGTAWIAEAGDATPRIEIELERPTTARAVTLSHPASSVESIGQSAGATKVHLWINKEKEPIVASLPAQSATTMVIPLPKKTRVRKLTLEIIECGGGSVARRGFAEIGLR